jgi:prolyl-tRNA synthetase
VEAESGAIGGSRSEEFMVASEIGDDRFVECPGCGYAANTERAEVGRPKNREKGSEEPEIREVDTPGATTIEEVSQLLEVDPSRMIKTLIYVAEGTPLAVLVRGDHELNENKLARALGAAEVELADVATIESVTGAPVGFAGPVGLEDLEVIADPPVMEIANGVTGANRADAHLVGVMPGRDFEPDRLEDVHTAVEGDPCPGCGTGMELHHGIEVGHVFQLGTKYSESLGATFLDADGRERPYIMGCYGIGLNRIAAAAIESFADEDGIVWPPAIAPFQAVVMPLKLDDEDVIRAAEQAYESLREAGIDAILDDREERPGSKFKDAELIGFPLQVVIGRGFQKTGKIEVQRRKDGQTAEVPPEDLVRESQNMLNELSDGSS